MIKIDYQIQQKAIQYFKNADPILYKAISQVTPPEWNFPSNYFISLVETIVSQQLSIKAADSIFAKLKALTDDPELTSEAILKMNPEKMRSAGLSWSKVNYVRNIAEYTLTSSKVFEKFTEMNDEEIINELTKIKGIGRWTAEMFLIFTMGRPDVFSVGDLGLRRAVENLYNLDANSNNEIILSISEKWKPYRSIASRYLWRINDLLKKK